MPKQGSHEMEKELQKVHMGIKHSRLKSTGFNWKKATERALRKQLYRARILAISNITYQIKYPNECKDYPDRATKCHPEAYKRILEEHEKILQSSMVPVVDRPKRLSRVG